MHYRFIYERNKCLFEPLILWSQKVKQNVKSCNKRIASTKRNTDTFNNESINVDRKFSTWFGGRVLKGALNLHVRLHNNFTLSVP